MRGHFDVPFQPTYASRVVGDLGIVVNCKIVGLLGLPGAGKTTLGTFVAADLARRGDQVVILDGDDNRADLVTRLTNLGLGRAVLSIKLLDDAEVREALANPDAFGKSLQFTRAVLLDGFRGLLARADYSEHPAHIGQFVGKYLRPWSRTTTVVVTDHPLRREVARPRARAGLEEALDVSWLVQTMEPFSRTQSGLIRLRRGKDRTGLFSPEDRAFALLHDEDGATRLVEQRTSEQAVDDAILNVVIGQPYLLTGTEIDAVIAEQVPLATRELVRARREALTREGLLDVERRDRPEGGRAMPRHLYGTGTER